MNEDVVTIDAMKEAAKEYDVEVGLELFDTTESRTNFLESAIETRSKSKVKLAMDLIKSKSLPFASTSRTVGKKFSDLLKGNQDFMHRALLDDTFVTEASTFPVDVEIFEEERAQRTLDHINTFNEYHEWTDHNDSETHVAKWESRDGRENSSEAHTRETLTSTTNGKLLFLGIENAAKAGPDGIVRHLLATKTATEIFESSAVGWTVDSKWKTWKWRFLRKAAIYALFLVLFVAYCIALDPHAKPQSQGIQWILLVAIATFGCWFLREELLQMRTYMNDGETMSRSRTKGLTYHFASKWNWLDMTSTSILVAVIPVLHVMAYCHRGKARDVLSIVVSVEALLAFFKVTRLDFRCLPHIQCFADLVFHATVRRDRIFGASCRQCDSRLLKIPRSHVLCHDGICRCAVRALQKRIDRRRRR